MADDGLPLDPASPEAGSRVDPRNRLNDLTGEEWLYFTKSAITTAYPLGHGHQLRRAHGANKPPQLMKELILFFTKAGGRVLDPFAGVGGTLLGAALCDPPREALGIEVNPRWTELYHEVVAASGGTLAGGTMLAGDCLEEMGRMEDGSFDFVATDPPYNLHLKRTMCDGRYDGEHANRRTDYDMRSDDPRDLANLGSYDAYLARMGEVPKSVSSCVELHPVGGCLRTNPRIREVFGHCLRLLVPGRYMALIVRNAYQDGEYIFTHAELARRAREVGFLIKGEKVWYQAGTRLRPYGYPYSYVPNISHQHIVFLQKPGDRKGGRAKR